VILRWAPRLAALLALAALALASVAGVTQGRYAASGSGGDSARVAAWDVEAEPTAAAQAADADGASAASYAFTISNKGEAAAECDVVVSLLSALPEGVSAELAVGDGAATGPSVTSDDKTTLTFRSAATLAPGKSAACELTFSDGRGADAAASVNGAAVSVSAWQAD
jgi:uncharacterized cupredoxin-like copper-binding protein